MPSDGMCSGFRSAKQLDLIRQVLPLVAKLFTLHFSTVM